MQADAVSELRRTLSEEGLQELPSGLADAEVSLVAHHLFTAEIYDVEWTGHWLKVRDLGKDRLTTREVRPGQLRRAIASALPSRTPSVLADKRWQGRQRVLLRFRGRVPATIEIHRTKVREDSMQLVPCPTPTGQCFWVDIDEMQENKP